MKRFYFILLTTLSFCSVINAQESEHLSGFSTLSLTYKFNPKWYIYGETQIRSIADFSEIDYYEIKGGGGYNIDKKQQAFVGFGRYTSYTNHKITRIELRAWAQYVYSHYFSRVKIEQRVRAEKRFFHDPVSGIDVNAERYRYRANVIIPLNKEKIEAKTLFANTYDEVFFISEEPKPAFSRNRLFGGLGYQATNSLGITLGYLWQRDFSVAKNTNTHFLFCGVNFSLSHKDHKPTSTIVTPDAD